MLPQKFINGTFTKIESYSTTAPYFDTKVEYTQSVEYLCKMMLVSKETHLSCLKSFQQFDNSKNRIFLVQIIADKIIQKQLMQNDELFYEQIPEYAQKKFYEQIPGYIKYFNLMELLSMSRACYSGILLDLDTINRFDDEEYKINRIWVSLENSMNEIVSSARPVNNFLPLSLKRVNNYVLIDIFKNNFFDNFDISATDFGDRCNLFHQSLSATNFGDRFNLFHQSLNHPSHL